MIYRALAIFREPPSLSRIPEHAYEIAKTEWLLLPLLGQDANCELMRQCHALGDLSPILGQNVHEDIVLITQLTRRPILQNSRAESLA